ncbi:SPRY domain-containing SOCS box protein 3-like [Homarus americanus]|uniref:SPRY domain-containing SOCS box protein 3-like n=1 Tax=Homarus americanus TaxID=6706 RepID=UPI001C45A32F|nr:SPRY domain-containing SOCS box protein 3-like [Homarus americanus]XP_042222414.1 SPRY domain-containing SOCS box protein 3-like [Homarus americanus]
MSRRTLMQTTSVYSPYCRSTSQSTSAFCMHTNLELIQCSCGEEETDFAWVWSTCEQSGQAGSILLDCDDRQISFNPAYSSGTAAIRGNEILSPGHHHFWELKMTSDVYGTDVMIGVCTPKCDLSHGISRFCSLLGRDKESWGYSYTGIIRHASQFRPYGPRWGKGSIVGIHLDMWRGTLKFFLNRKPLGIAFTGLQNLELYPVVTSTSAHSGMKLVTSCIFPANLQFLSSEVVLKHICEKMKVRPEDLPLPPGLRSFMEDNYWPPLCFIGLSEETDVKEKPKWFTVNRKHPSLDDPPCMRRFKRSTLVPFYDIISLGSSSDTSDDDSYDDICPPSSHFSPRVFSQQEFGNLSQASSTSLSLGNSSSQVALPEEQPASDPSSRTSTDTPGVCDKALSSQ